MDTDSARIPVRSHRQAMDWSLVLASQDIPAFISESETRQLRRRVETHLKSLKTPGDRMGPAIP